MTFTDDGPTTAAAAPSPAPATGRSGIQPTASAAQPLPTGAGAPPWEQCDRCAAPVEPAQRYCVACGTHQRRADDPTTRFFAAARRPRVAAVPVVRPGDARTVSSTVAAVLIALLPVAAGIGIVVGRGSADSGDQVIEALKAMRQVPGQTAAAPVAVSATTPAGDDGTTTTASDDDDEAADEKDDGPKVEGVETSSKQAPILASGPTGSARKLEGTKPTKKDIDESKDAVERINSRKGKEYIDQQRDLPDTIVIP